MTRSAAADAFTSIRSPDLVDIAEAQIQAAILNGQFAPGERIIEAELARRMGISRAPVREAARRLESAGLLTSRPRHGFFVKTLSVREVDDLYQVRIDLELLGVRLACAQASDGQLARLVTMVDHMVEQSSRLNRAERVALDLGFHAYIAEISGNLYLQRLFDNMQAEVRMFQSLNEPGYEDPHFVAESHRPIVKAFIRRDAEATQAALRFHLEAAHEQTRVCVARAGLNPSGPLQGTQT
ncbi:MAG TPA: GntR family transcriptional regulator [Bordetella sp.]